ncbi:hypothetical protein ACROYT_G014318 [Oculina patagonica]
MSASPYTRTNRLLKTSGQPCEQKPNTGVWRQDILNWWLVFNTFEKHSQYGKECSTFWKKETYTKEKKNRTPRQPTQDLPSQAVQVESCAHKKSERKTFPVLLIFLGLKPINKNYWLENTKEIEVEASKLLEVELNQAALEAKECKFTHAVNSSVPAALPSEPRFASTKCSSPLLYDDYNDYRIVDLRRMVVAAVLSDVRIVEVQYRTVPGVPSQTKKIHRRKSRNENSLNDEGLLTTLRKWTSGDKRVPFSFNGSTEQSVLRFACTSKL